jgi:hypothetical protein
MSSHASRQRTFWFDLGQSSASTPASMPARLGRLSRGRAHTPMLQAVRDMSRSAAGCRRTFLDASRTCDRVTCLQMRSVCPSSGAWMQSAMPRPPWSLTLRLAPTCSPTFHPAAEPPEATAVTQHPRVWLLRPLGRWQKCSIPLWPVLRKVG